MDYEPLPHAFRDDDFEVATRVQANYAGPDAASLHEGGIVHETTVPVLASHECQRLVAEVEAMLGARAANPLTYGKGQGDTLYSVPEVERRVVHVHAMSAYGSSWLQQKLRTHFFPMVADRCGTDPCRMLRAMRTACALHAHCMRTARALRYPAHALYPSRVQLRFPV